MLDLMDFKTGFVEQCQNTLHEYGPSGMRIEEREIRKAQRGTLHGMLFIADGMDCVPTLYVEDFYREYKAGAGLKDLSYKAVDVVISSLGMSDLMAEKTESLISDPGNLRVRLIDKTRNRDYLKGIPVKDAGCGFVFIADIEEDEYRVVVTDDLLKKMNMSKDELFDEAFRNTVESCPAVLCDLYKSAACLTGMSGNLLETTAKRMQTDSGPGFVLTNSRCYWGAGALFYPGVIERIHELLDSDFYVLPSSVHELILIRVEGQDPEQLASVIREANRTVVDEWEILANDLYICKSGSLRRVSYGGVVPPDHMNLPS